MKTLMRLMKEESGQGLVEYVLIIALIAAVCVVILQSIGTKANTKLTDVDGSLN